MESQVGASRFYCAAGIEVLYNNSSSLTWDRTWLRNSLWTVRILLWSACIVSWWQGIGIYNCFNLDQAPKIGRLLSLPHPCFVLEKPFPGLINILSLVVQFLFPYSSPISATTLFLSSISSFKDGNESKPPQKRSTRVQCILPFHEWRYCWIHLRVLDCIDACATSCPSRYCCKHT